MAELCGAGISHTLFFGVETVCTDRFDYQRMLSAFGVHNFLLFEFSALGVL